MAIILNPDTNLDPRQETVIIIQPHTTQNQAAEGSNCPQATICPDRVAKRLGAVDGYFLHDANCNHIVRTGSAGRKIYSESTILAIVICQRSTSIKSSH